MKQLSKFSIVLMILTVLGLSSIEELYAQNISSRTFVPDGISIVGGEKVDPGEYPWQVALMEFGEQICGGTLITPDWVLTAAHCVEYGADQVMLGAHRLDKADEVSRQLIDVSRVIVHPKYDSYMIDSDIALLKLAEPATLNDRVQTIELLQSQAAAGTLSTIIGWGATSEMGSSSNVLQEVSVPLVSHAMCTRVYGDDVTENMICAGLAKGGKDSCYGDSGGPLVVSDGGDGWLQAGIVSWGEGCALKGSYGVYTNLPLFVDWIQGYLDGTTVDEDVAQSSNDADQQWYEAAAAVIGMDVDILQSQVDEGQSIAEIASANNVDLQSVIDAMQAAEEASIQQLLADGEITQQEADEWLEVLPELLDTFVNETLYDDWLDFFPGGIEPIDWDEIAAQTIGIDIETLYEQWWTQEQSIAEIATANEVDPQSVIIAIIAAESDYIQLLTDDGLLTQEEADEWIAALPEDVASYVNDLPFSEIWPDDSWPDEPIDVAYVSWDEAAAQAIGIDIETFYELQWDQALSIAEIATANEIDPQTVISAVITAEIGSLQQLVDAEILTQEEVDEWISILPEDVASYVNDPPFSDWPDGPTDDELIDIEYVDWNEVAAQTIGIDIDAYYELQWDQGQSIAEIATANGIELQTVIDAVIAAETGYIQQLVDAEYIMQEEADEWNATLSDDVASFVNESPYPNDFIDFEPINWEEIAAQTIGIDGDTFYGLLWDQGQSIAEIAITYEVEPQSVISAVITAESDLTQQLIESEYLTQEEADEWLATLPKDIAYFVYKIYTDWDSVAAETIGIDLDTLYELWWDWDKGQSIAEIATENGIEPQSVIDAIIAAEQSAIEQMIANGYEMTQEEVDEWIASLSERVIYFVDDAIIIDDWPDYPDDNMAGEDESSDGSSDESDDETDSDYSENDSYYDDEADDDEADDNEAEDESGNGPSDESDDEIDSDYSENDSYYGDEADDDEADDDEADDDEAEDESGDGPSDESDDETDSDYSENDSYYGDEADDNESDDESSDGTSDESDDEITPGSDETDSDSQDGDVADEDESVDDTATDDDDSQGDDTDEDSAEDETTPDSDETDSDETDSDETDSDETDSNDTDSDSQDSDVADDDTATDDSASQDDDASDETIPDSDDADGDSQDTDVDTDDQGAEDVPTEPALEDDSNHSQDGDETDGDSQDTDSQDSDEADENQSDDTTTDDSDLQDGDTSDEMTPDSDEADGDSQDSDSQDSDVADENESDDTSDETTTDSDEADGDSQDSDSQDSDVVDETQSDDTATDDSDSQDGDTDEGPAEVETDDETSDGASDDTTPDDVSDEDQNADDVPAEPVPEEGSEPVSLSDDSDLPADGSDVESDVESDGTAAEDNAQKDTSEDTAKGTKMLWVDWFEVAAQALNMEIKPFSDALDEGHSIIQIAADNGAESQAVIDAVVRAEQEMIQQNVADGLFPQDKADEWLAELPEVAAHFVEDAAGCTDIDMIDGVDWFAVAVQSIAVDETTFWITVDQGQNIAEIAQANGVDSQTVIDAIARAEAAQAAQQVADGLITQADADEWLTGLNTFVAEFVDMKFADDKSEESDKEVDGNNEEGTEQSMPKATVAAAGMTLELYKNARTKTPAAFSTDNNSTIYLPMVMK